MTLLSFYSHALVPFLLLSTSTALPEWRWPFPTKGGLIGFGAQRNTTNTPPADPKKSPEPKKSSDLKKSPDPKKSSEPKKPAEKKPLTVTTEKSADCNEFPDPGYGGSDPDTYKFWPEASRIGVTCYSEQYINGFNYTYLRTTSGCYIDEEHVQGGNIDFTSRLPKCSIPKPYQVYTTKNEYLLPKDGFWMSCYDKPKKTGKKFEVQWGARHVACSVEGESINGDNTWWRDSHSLDGKEERHCYVPDDAFDNMVYEVPGGGKKCDEDKKT